MCPSFRPDAAAAVEPPPPVGTATCPVVAAETAAVLPTPASALAVAPAAALALAVAPSAFGLGPAPLATGRRFGRHLALRSVALAALATVAACAVVCGLVA